MHKGHRVDFVGPLGNEITVPRDAARAVLVAGGVGVGPIKIVAEELQRRGIKDITATAHVELLVEDASTAYLAPEAVLHADNPGEHLDVFSLGAIAYHVFTGTAPAGSRLNSR